MAGLLGVLRCALLALSCLVAHLLPHKSGQPTVKKEIKRKKNKLFFPFWTTSTTPSQLPSAFRVASKQQQKSGKKTKAQSRLPGIPFFNPLCLAVVLPFSLAETNIKTKTIRKRKTKTLPVACGPMLSKYAS